MEILQFNRIISIWKLKNKEKDNEKLKGHPKRMINRDARNCNRNRKINKEFRMKWKKWKSIETDLIFDINFARWLDTACAVFVMSWHMLANICIKVIKTYRTQTNIHHLYFGGHIFLQNLSVYCVTNMTDTTMGKLQRFCGNLSQLMVMIILWSSGQR